MYERHKCSMCTHSKAAISVQDNANTMEILSYKNKINALLILISYIQRSVPPKCLDRKANTRNFFFSLCLQLSSLSSICLFCRSTWSSPFSVSVSSFTACHSPVYSSPVSFSVSSSKFSSASCCSLIHFKGANYIFSNFCVL